jgi:hypothetical protein
LVVRLVFTYLRGEIVWSANFSRHQGLGTIEDLGKTKISYSNRVIFHEKNVEGLKISMENILGVEIVNS